MEASGRVGVSPGRCWVLVHVQLEVLVVPQEAAPHLEHCVMLVVTLGHQNLVRSRQAGLEVGNNKKNTSLKVR